MTVGSGVGVTVGLGVGVGAIVGSGVGSGVGVAVGVGAALPHPKESNDIVPENAISADDSGDAHLNAHDGLRHLMMTPAPCPI